MRKTFTFTRVPVFFVFGLFFFLYDRCWVSSDGLGYGLVIAS